MDQTRRLGYMETGYPSTPSRIVVSNLVLWISSALSLSSCASQLAHTNFPFRNAASGDASHT